MPGNPLHTAIEPRPWHQNAKFSDGAGNDQYGRAVAMAYSQDRAPQGDDGGDVLLDTDGLALDNTGGVDLGGFSAFLEAKADRLLTVPDGQFTHLDTLVERYDQNLRLKLPPEQLVFIEN